MMRGDVYDARLDPVEGSEQKGSRPVVIVSRNAINSSSPIVVVVPCTTYRAGRRLYPSHVLVRTPDGGLTADSVALSEQVRVLDKNRLLRRRGALSPAAMEQLNRALLITLDLHDIG
ncbi:MAG: type II toxin-antitoxin system PemK/MazF family toxin, partial [Acidobacteria bacterium]|nr:type II toxin-antitoxin system PemK/MazF family toxin [Acidobacteriota bacterium]